MSKGEGVRGRAWFAWISVSVVVLNFTGTEDGPGEPNQPVNDTLTVNADGTFSLASDPGVIVGLIPSPTQVISVNHAKNTWTSILVFNAAH